MKNMLLIAAVVTFCGIGWFIMTNLDRFLNLRSREKTMPLDEEKEIEKESWM